ncbi:MAG: hypothetical protein ACRDXF_00260 [Acidimicrobiia bacterium]
MSRRIELALLELAHHIDWPEQSAPRPDLHLRLAARPVTRIRYRWIPVTVLLLVLVASLLLFSPRARQAVADLLGVAGIEIGFDPDPVDMVGGELDLGEPVTVEEAAEAVDFELSAPGRLGSPDAVFLSDRPSSGRVSMVWEVSETLPASGDSGIGLIYSQFEMDLGASEGFIKSVSPDSSVRGVEIEGMLGLWIEGAPHVISYEDADGNRVEEETRLAGNVLMWESEGVTHRIETTLGLHAALSLARSLQPA